MKKVFLKITNTKRLYAIANILLIVIFSITTFSCSKDDDVKPPVIADEISQDIKDLIYFRGDEKASTVLITVPGGPSTELATGIVDYLSNTFNLTGVLNVTVHQAQTLNPDILEGNEITLDQAVNFNAESVEKLYQVVKYFKDEGRTIYILGNSYGAFVAQELIAEKGFDVADKYLIVTGRLNINDVFWQALAEGRLAEFENGVTPIIAPEPFENTFNKNEARLFAGIIKNRYIQDFNSIEDLSNMTYIYGATDEAVGGLTDQEITFLQSKNTNIIAGDGGHDTTLDDYIVQGFNEAFGIQKRSF
ncbi:hypothetical protein [Aquimarina algicola]|uniref:Alpha/beta hydrolase n=1 Tax=Aquimarina algicola TaxID=2589995 RepID=A0A504JD67_9FLAO|nr:hypothetical protein [Aquimarina algicola]TPN88807.1 hypothetical protein FHK87_00925 [Aquimarina algicola]